MKKKIVTAVLLAIVLILIITTVFVIFFRESKKEYKDPEYNTENITGINTLDIKNDNIKNKYQFVFITDLHASVEDENEKDEKIRQALIERNNNFTSLNKNKVKSDSIFKEIVNYTNNKNADALLLGGDILDTPADSNLKFLNENLNNLKTKYLYTFGNHDWTFSWNYQSKETKEKYIPKFNELMQDTEVSYLEYEDLIILAIDDGTNKISESAMEKVKNVLEKKKPTIVMLHVPIATQYIADETVKIRNRNSTIGKNGGVKTDETTLKTIDMILSKEYNVFYVIAGHVHFSIRDTLENGIPEEVSAPAYEGVINLIKINN